MNNKIIILVDEDKNILGTVLVTNYDERFDEKFWAVLYGSHGVLSFEENEDVHLHELMVELNNSERKQKAVVDAMKAKGYDISFISNMQMELY